MSLIVDGGDLLKNIQDSVRSGSQSLEKELSKLSGELSYPETAYYLPVSYALTGIPVRDGKTATEAYLQVEKNTLVAGQIFDNFGTKPENDLSLVRQLAGIFFAEYALGLKRIKQS